MNPLIKELVEQIPLEDRQTFKRYIAYGEASEDFKQRFKDNPLYQEIGDKVLVELYRPFSEAIKAADERVNQL